MQQEGEISIEVLYGKIPMQVKRPRIVTDILENIFNIITREIG